MERNENKSKLNVSELKCETSILFVMCRYVHNTSFLFFFSSLFTNEWLFCLSRKKKHDDNKTTLATTKNKTVRWVLSTQWYTAKSENGIEDDECIEDALAGMKMRRNSICLQHSIKGSRFLHNHHSFILNLVLNHSIERTYFTHFHHESFGNYFGSVFFFSFSLFYNSFF